MFSLSSPSLHQSETPIPPCMSLNTWFIIKGNNKGLTLLPWCVLFSTGNLSKWIFPILTCICFPLNKSFIIWTSTDTRFPDFEAFEAFSSHRVEGFFHVSKHLDYTLFVYLCFPDFMFQTQYGSSSDSTLMFRYVSLIFYMVRDSFTYYSLHYFTDIRW